MKTRILLTVLGVAALAAITLNVNAGDSLLSPRAVGNQIKTTPVVSIVSAAPVINFASPRALGSQTIAVASVANDVNPSIACRSMTSSPKAIQACAVNSTAAMPCCAKPVATVN
ncbi:MAG TPA: hypothetical protein VKU37_14545 [Verrucomicrobiae bacterium]|nr:hypothetical protein [Verrucomicrobiae bacterium]